MMMMLLCWQCQVHRARVRRSLLKAGLGFQLASPITWDN